MVPTTPSISSKGYVLITGASTGIGKACTLHLAGLGFSVLAGVRREPDAQALARLAPGGAIRGLTLDITDAASVAAAAQAATDIVGPAGLRGLINNAGICVAGPVEFVALDEWRRQFEVNVFGQIAVTQAMLPLLRRFAAAGDSSARIVTIGSIAGRASQPILAPYCASKHAIEALSDALRLELAADRIDVSLIEPGAVQTEIWRKGEQTVGAIPEDSPSMQRYGKFIDAMARTSRVAAERAVPAERVAREVERCLTRRRPPTRVLVGSDAKMAAIARAWLPDRWFDALLRRAMGL